MNLEKHKQAGDFYYCPHDILGTGVWGTVYKAKNINDTNDKFYALKKINKYKIEASQSSFQKYKNEVISLRKGNQIKEIIKFVDFFKSKSNYYIITQYIPGSIDLYRFLEDNPSKFTQIQARIIWVDILNGIQKLHNLKIIHRDLKLQNILYIPQRKMAKIIDFGLATTFGHGSGRVGSLIFMSPQIINNQPYTQKCDIWSIGIVFYWMICRCSPYGQNSSLNRITQIMKQLSSNSTLPIPKGIFVSENCQKVILSCLKWEQKQRLDAKQLLQLPFFKTPDLQQFGDCLGYYEPQLTFGK